MTNTEKVDVHKSGPHGGAHSGNQDDPNVDGYGSNQGAPHGGARISNQDGLNASPPDSFNGDLPDSVSLGVDIVEIERMRSILKRSPAFARRAFSEDEQTYCNSTATPEYHYATRFAAKEAVLKALGTGFSDGIGLRDVEVVADKLGKPRIRLYRRAREVALAKGVTELPISLSYTHKEAVACAMALTDEAKVAARPQSQNPTAELTRQFKEARSLLDEIPPQSIHD